MGTLHLMFLVDMLSNHITSVDHPSAHIYYGQTVLNTTEFLCLATDSSRNLSALHAAWTLGLYCLEANCLCCVHKHIQLYIPLLGTHQCFAIIIHVRFQLHRQVGAWNNKRCGTFYHMHKQKGHVLRGGSKRNRFIHTFFFLNNNILSKIIIYNIIWVERSILIIGIIKGRCLLVVDRLMWVSLVYRRFK